MKISFRKMRHLTASMAVCIAFFSLSLTCLQAQQITVDSGGDIEQLKKDILVLNENVERIQLNLGRSQNKFKRGILVATIGYTVTIAGGLMLGRKNDELGKVLLVAGGATGVTGTVMMVDAFKFLGKAAKRSGG